MVTLFILVVVLALILMLYMFFISITLNNKVISAVHTNEFDTSEHFIIINKCAVINNANDTEKEELSALSIAYVEINLYNYILFCFDMDILEDYFVKHRIILNK